MKQSAKPYLATIFISLGLLGGCASSEPTSQPTHRWAGNAAADSVEYHNDHAQCQQEAGIRPQQRQLETQSAQFQSYKQCMTNRGYQLTAYRDHTR